MRPVKTKKSLRRLDVLDNPSLHGAMDPREEYQHEMAVYIQSLFRHNPQIILEILWTPLYKSLPTNSDLQAGDKTLNQVRCGYLH